MASKTYIKDRADFIRFYEKKHDNILKETVSYREIENDKIEVKIMIPSMCSIVKEELSKIKN